MRNASHRWRGLSALVLLALGCVAASYAAESRQDSARQQVERGGDRDVARGGDRGVERGRPGPGRGEVLDNRYNHGHYYPRSGALVRALPGGYRPYYYRGSRYYFSGGIWYAPGPYGFIVTRPPPGLFLTVLPPFYTTVWVGGAPYYYADNVYYQWQPGANGYAVVEPPEGADQPSGPPAGAPAADDFFIYPKNGQTQEQQAADQYECHDWAKNQTGFDPTQQSGGVSPNETGSRREQYQRAMTACLEARGYSIK
jgi:hypothetical protein